MLPYPPPPLTTPTPPFPAQCPSPSALLNRKYRAPARNQSWRCSGLGPSSLPHFALLCAHLPRAVYARHAHGDIRLPVSVQIAGY
jgi:hypothetical protein